MSDSCWLKLQQYAGVIHDHDPRFGYTVWVLAQKDEDSGDFYSADDSDLPIEPTRILEQREIAQPQESDEEVTQREYAYQMAELWSEAYNAGAKEWEANLRTRGLLREGDE